MRQAPKGIACDSPTSELRPIKNAAEPALAGRLQTQPVTVITGGANRTNTIAQNHIARKYQIDDLGRIVLAIRSLPECHMKIERLSPLRDDEATEVDTLTRIRRYDLYRAGRGSVKEGRDLIARALRFCRYCERE